MLERYSAKKTRPPAAWSQVRPACVMVGRVGRPFFFARVGPFLWVDLVICRPPSRSVRPNRLASGVRALVRRRRHFLIRGGVITEGVTS